MGLYCAIALVHAAIRSPDKLGKYVSGRHDMNAHSKSWGSVVASRVWRYARADGGRGKLEQRRPCVDFLGLVCGWSGNPLHPRFQVVKRKGRRKEGRGGRVDAHVKTTLLSMRRHGRRHSAIHIAGPEADHLFRQPPCPPCTPHVTCRSILNASTCSSQTVSICLSQHASATCVRTCILLLIASPNMPQCVTLEVSETVNPKPSTLPQYAVHNNAP